MTFNSSSVHWIFLTSYDEDVATSKISFDVTNAMIMAKLRHIYDVIHGINILEHLNINSTNISLLVDMEQNKFDECCDAIVENKYKIFPTDNFSKIIKKRQLDTNIIFLMGHGNEGGIKTIDNYITPTKLVKWINEANVRLTIVIFDICHSGVFNNKNLINNSNIIFIGASNFSTSLSCPISVRTKHTNNSTDQIPWNANIFFLNICDWFLNPKDIDDDNKFTIVDLYKYSGINTEKHLANYRNSYFPQAITNIVTKQSRYNQINSKISLTQIEQFERAILWNDIKNSISILEFFNTRECWICNFECAYNSEYVK